MTKTSDTEGYIGVTTMVQSKSGEGVVVFKWGKESGILTPQEAREHALLVLAAAEAAESDELIVRFAKQRVGLDSNKATAMLRDFRKLRDQAGSKVAVDIPSAAKAGKGDA